MRKEGVIKAVECLAAFLHLLLLYKEGQKNDNSRVNN